jgi:hypothetical protein
MMKTKYISSLLLLSLLFTFSCKKELVPQESSGISNPATTENGSESTVVSSATNVNPTQSVPIPQQNSNINASALNPPHGQAGHRCDIAVGAALNSPPNKAISKSTVTNSVQNPQVPTIIKPNVTTAVVTKPGMNPPHGQTGHRCDVAVGAPLNSAPNKAVSAVTNSEPNSQVPAILKLDSTAIAPK